MSNSNTAQKETPAPRITSRSIAMQLTLVNLALRCQYHNVKPFTVEAKDKHSATNETGLFESYTQFRQTTRDQIIEACGCTAASARTMFIWAKDNIIEQCKADGHFEIEINGKKQKLTLEQLSLKRDLKPKPVKAPKEEKASAETPAEGNEDATEENTDK